MTATDSSGRGAAIAAAVAERRKIDKEGKKEEAHEDVKAEKQDEIQEEKEPENKTEETKDARES